MGERQEEKVRNTNLGPGKYNVPSYEINHEGGPHWTIKGKNPIKGELNGVGPGQYNL